MGKFLVGFHSEDMSNLAKEGHFALITPTVIWTVSKINSIDIELVAIHGCYNNSRTIIKSWYMENFNHYIAGNWFTASKSMVKNFVKTHSLRTYKPDGSSVPYQ